jgi:hypothetical protein
MRSLCGWKAAAWACGANGLSSNRRTEQSLARRRNFTNATGRASPGSFSN